MNDVLRFFKKVFYCLLNAALMPGRVNLLCSELPNFSRPIWRSAWETRQEFKRNYSGGIFANLNDIDDSLPSFLVCVSHFRMLRYIEPLLNMAREEGYQIIVLNAPRLDFDSEQFKMTRYIKKYKIINLSPWHDIFESSYGTFPDYIFFFYALLYNYNIKSILVDELHHPPLSRFALDFPYIKELMPPIIAFKHALLFPEYLEDYGLKAQTEILEKYCDLHFVWGDLQKNMYSHLPREKVISAGYNALEHLKNVSTSYGKKVFLASGPAYSGAKCAEAQVIEELLEHTDFEVYVKAHPEPKKKHQYTPHDRLHIMGRFDDYIPMLASCAFSLSYASNIFAESLCLGKPHIILPSPASSDHIFDPLRSLFVYEPDAVAVKADKLTAMAESQIAQWEEVDEYLNQVAANRFNSSEFMLRRIQAEIKKHENGRADKICQTH